MNPVVYFLAAFLFIVIEVLVLFTLGYAISLGLVFVRNFLTARSAASRPPATPYKSAFLLSGCMTFQWCVVLVCFNLRILYSPLLDDERHNADGLKAMSVRAQIAAAFFVSWAIVLAFAALGIAAALLRVLVDRLIDAVIKGWTRLRTKGRSIDAGGAADRLQSQTPAKENES